MGFPELVLVAWIPISAALFALFKPARALVLAYMIGWLCLPIGAISIQGFWDVNKIVATNAGVLLGSLLFHSGRLASYRIHVADVALFGFAAAACITSIVNDLGAYDGLSSMSHKLLLYAVPFVSGRLFLRTSQELREACRLAVAGAALYAVAAVWEWHMSPQLHVAIYGFFQHGWTQHIRWGFWRPIVFFPHALGLASFFVWTSLVGLWLWRAGRLRPVFGLPPLAIAALPALGLLVSMSVGPWILFLGGAAILVSCHTICSRKLLWVPVMFVLYWMVGRYSGATDGQWLTSAVARISEQRAGSLEYRVNAETLLVERAKLRPVFGWGGWGRNRAGYDRGEDLVATDGLWIIYAGSYGVVGLGLFYLWWCWPVIMSARTPQLLQEPVLMALVVCVGVQAVNFLFNGFLDPVLTVLCGGTVSAIAALKYERQTQRLGVSIRASASGRPYSSSVRCE